ncbi:hypothetical protein EPO44_07015 [bacterium]|nr:MAG: hypothetical protein EPO44_07015 [bacterium]
MEAKLITLITDFGYKDPFVGIMKGVIFSINPNANIIDLSHGIPPQDLMAGALVLRYTAPSFPRGTIHVAVVDPGVGTKRRPLLIESEECFFIGPDNGVLSLALEGKKVSRTIQLSNETYHLKPTSVTFHGRDIFAPVAAYLSLGVPPEDFGETVNDLIRLPWPAVTKTEGALVGKVIYIDGFGNLITNIHDRDLSVFQTEKLTVSVAGVTIRGIAPHYSSGEEKSYAALINSWGLLEISAFKGNAQLLCGAKIGDKVFIREGQGVDGKPHER